MSTFAPTAEFPGLLNVNLKRNTATAEGTSGKWTTNQDYTTKVTVTGSKQLFYNCWFRRGVDPMRSTECAFVHCKFGDEHLGILDPANPQYTQLLDSYRKNGAAVDGSQWGVKAQFLWCEYTGFIVDGTKASHGMTVADSYFHDFARIRTDFYTTLTPGSTDLYTHNDAIQMLQAPASFGPVNFLRNRVVMRQEHMSAFMIGPDSADIAEVVIDGNFLSARNCIFLITKKAGGTLRKVTIRNNVFSKACQWVVVSQYLDTKVTQVVWENNKWDDGKVLSFADACKNPSPRAA